MEVNFIGGAYEGRSRNINAQVCQNLFPVTDKTGGKTVLALIGTPGSRAWFSSGATGEVRGLLVWGDYLYAAIGSGLWKIGADGSGASVGTLTTTTGRVWMAGGLTYLTLVDGHYGYYRAETDTTLTTITDSDFPGGPSSVAYQDGRFVVTQGGTDYFFISSSEDPSSWSALDFAAADDEPDDVLAVVSHNRELVPIGAHTTEFFANTGNSAFPFTRASGAVAPTGCGAVNSIYAGPEGLFFLDDLGHVVMRNGYGFGAISTDQIDYQIASYARTSDAVGYAYTQEGHQFYVISFPTPSKTWVFDVTTGLWHTRSTGLGGRRHRGQYAARFANKVLVGDYQDGNVYELDLDAYSDAEEIIEAVRVCQPIHSGRKLITFSRFEIEFEAGVGLATGTGSAPYAMLTYSNDGGSTWSGERWATIGEIGDRGARAVWWRLGSGRQRIFKVRITDPVKRVIIGAYLDARAD